MEINNRVLLVDDELKNLKILRLRLEDDYQLKEVDSGERALELIEDFQPAVVLLDIMMGGMDGYEVTKAIKSNPKTKNCKVILVSGKAMIDEKLEGYRVGAEDYMTKPFNGKELLAKVNVFSRLYNLEQELKKMNKSLEKEVELRSEQLLKNERMAFVGMHASEIVHNLNNPLAIIKGQNDYLIKKIPEMEEAKAIEKAVKKLLDIVKDILKPLNHDIKSDMTEISINDIILEELKFLDTLDPHQKYNVEKTLNLRSKSNIYASPSHLTQVIGNLIKNSAEAMVDSKLKNLTISSSDRGDIVEVVIEDTGEGISKENLERIFEPLFTTKKGEGDGIIGSGLGLPFCKKMIESYGGSLSIRSKLNEGTSVSIKLPAKKR